MQRPRVRPKIELIVEQPPDEVLARFEQCLKLPECRGSVLGSCIEITVSDDEQHFWSPQLSLQVHEQSSGSLIYGRLGPKPHVWTMLIAGYAIVSISLIFAMFFAFSQWLLDEPVWALWALPIAVLMIALVYGTASIGQRLGAEQTHRLAELVTKTLELSPSALGI